MSVQNHITPSRRAVIRTAAWSVPAVSLAAAAPAFAVSPEASGSLSFNNGALPYWSGTRNGAGQSGWIRIQNMSVVNNGPDPLPAGTLMFTITLPSAWGTVTGLSPGRPWPAGWVWESSGSTLTIMAGPTVGAIPAGGRLNVADIGGIGNDDLWFDTSQNNGGVLSQISVTVGTYNTNTVVDYTGQSVSATVNSTVVARVWSAPF